MSEEEDQDYLLEEVIDRLNNLIRIGQICKVHNDGRVKVKIGEITTDWLEVLQNKAGKSIKKYSPPNVLETVLIISPMGDLEQGLVLPGLFTGAIKAPEGIKGREINRFGEGDTYLNITFGPGKYGIENQEGSLIAAIADALLALTKGSVEKKPIQNASGLPIADDPSFKAALKNIKSFIDSEPSQS